MLGVLDFDTVWRMTLGGLSLLAALHHAARYPDELHHLLERYRYAVRASLQTGRRARRTLAALALIAGLTIGLAMPALYLLHCIEALTGHHAEVVAV